MRTSDVKLVSHSLVHCKKFIPFHVPTWCSIVAIVVFCHFGSYWFFFTVYLRVSYECCVFILTKFSQVAHLRYFHLSFLYFCFHLFISMTSRIFLRIFFHFLFLVFGTELIGHLTFVSDKELCM